MGDSILFPPTLSSSSMKITHGALALASPETQADRERRGGRVRECEMGNKPLWRRTKSLPTKRYEAPVRGEGAGDSLKRFLMRLAPTPTNISSNSEPEA